MLDYQINKVIQESYGKVCRGKDGCHKEKKCEKAKRFVRAKRLLNEEYDPNEFEGGVGDYLKAGWEGAKEGFSSGMAKTGAEIKKGFQRLGSNIARPFVGGEKADEWNAAMDSEVEDVYDKHDLGYDDRLTKLGEFGGKMAGTALPLAATGAAMKGVGAGLDMMAKGGAAASTAGTAAANTSKLAKAAGAARPWVERGLKWYGPHAVGQEVGDTLEKFGHDKLATAARVTGDLIGAKGAFGPTSKVPINWKTVLAGGVPGGLGAFMATKNVAQAAADRGLISKDTQERLNTLGAVGGFGGAQGLVAWPAVDYAVNDATPEMVKAGMEVGKGGSLDDFEPVDVSKMSDEELLEMLRVLNGGKLPEGIAPLAANKIQQDDSGMSDEEFEKWLQEKDDSDSGMSDEEFEEWLNEV